MDYRDDKIEHIEDDVEKIQVRTGMYISYKGYKGALHLTKEVINNAIDELTNLEAIKIGSGAIDIHYDENTNTITVIDDGRGLPFEDVIKVSTKLQSGSKFRRQYNKKSAGENG